MFKNKYLFNFCVILPTILAAVPASAQPASASSAPAFPAKPVRIIVAFPAGGGLDFTTRVVAQKLAEAWAQQVVVENRPGASGMIGADLQRVLALADVKERLAAQGGDAHYSSAETFGVFMKAEHAKYAKVIAEAKIKVD